jgi:hypothetical protein
VNNSQNTQSYDFHGMNIRVSSSDAIARCLDARFHMLPSNGKCAETLFFDFESVSNTRRHRFGKPPGRAKSFYKLEGGDASYFEAEDQLYLCYGDRVRVSCSPDSGTARFSVLDPEIENLWIASHLLFTICLVEILKRRGLYSLHAGGLSANGKCVLIPGTSGAGKSTLTVASLRANFDYMSDDMVFLIDRPEGFHVLAFPEEVDVSDQTASFFPELSFLSGIPKRCGWRKRQIHPMQVYGAKVAPEAKAAAVVIPRIGQTEKSAITRIDADEALLEMVPNVLLTEPKSCRAHLSVLRELVTSTPCYRLETGRDFDQLSVRFREMLES